MFFAMGLKMGLNKKETEEGQERMGLPVRSVMHVIGLSISPYRQQAV